MAEKRNAQVTAIKIDFCPHICYNIRMNPLLTEDMKNIEQRLSQVLPKDITTAWQHEYFGTLPEGTVIQSRHIEPMIEPCRALVQHGGKRWRPLLLLLCAKMVAQKNGASADTAYRNALSLVGMVELVHTASLIHDDIEDNADTRRGAPAAHIAHGLDTALNAGAWLYFAAAACIDGAAIPDETKLRLYQLYARELRRLHLGQGMDIAWHRDAQKVPSVQEYMAMVRCKTGTLASLAAQTGAVAAGADSATADRLGAIAADIGAGFQVLDDVTNLTAGNPGKRRGDDIVEGKKSLPVLLFHAQADEGKRQALRACFVRAAEEGIESPAVEEAIALLTESGAIKSAYDTAARLVSDSCAALLHQFPAESDSAPSMLAAGLFTDLIDTFSL